MKDSKGHYLVSAIKPLYAIVFVALLGCQYSTTVKEPKSNRQYSEPVVVESHEAIEYCAEQKAFAGAAFGMSMNQVKALDYFTDWRIGNDSIDGDDIVCLKGLVQLGRGSLARYEGNLFFKDNKLYDVRIESGPFLETHYDSVKEDLMELKEIMEGAYGKPTYSYGIPSISKVKEKSASPIAYVWEIGKKKITLGVSTVIKSVSYGRFSEDYSAFARIEDTSITNKMNQKSKESIEDKKKKDSSLF